MFPFDKRVRWLAGWCLEHTYVFHQPTGWLVASQRSGSGFGVCLWPGTALQGAFGFGGAVDIGALPQSDESTADTNWFGRGDVARLYPGVECLAGHADHAGGLQCSEEPQWCSSPIRRQSTKYLTRRPEIASF